MPVEDPPKKSRRERIKSKELPMPPKGKPVKRTPPDEFNEGPQALQYDQERLKRAVKMVEETGMLPIHAWQACGGTRRTYERYIQKARWGIEPYTQIVEAMDAAAATWISKIVPTAWGHLAKKGDGKGLFDAIGRHSKDWSQKQSVQIVRDPDQDLLWQMMLEEFGAEATEKFAARYERALEGRTPLPGDESPGASG